MEQLSSYLSYLFLTAISVVVSGTFAVLALMSKDRELPFKIITARIQGIDCPYCEDNIEHKHILGVGGKEVWSEPPSDPSHPLPFDYSQQIGKPPPVESKRMP